MKKTLNLVIAAFMHDISRDGEPQTHIHAVVNNATEFMEKWKSLSSSNNVYGRSVEGVQGFIERIKSDVHILGAVFRSETARNVIQLGLAIRKTNPTFFELAAISDAQCAVYSTRTKVINDYMALKRLDRGKIASQSCD